MFNIFKHKPKVEPKPAPKPEPTPQRFCRNCKYNIAGSRASGMTDRCKHPKAERGNNSVTGAMVYKRCFDMRFSLSLRGNISPNICGDAAQFYEAKEQEQARSAF